MKVLIVGLGSMGQKHFDAIQRTSLFEVVAVVECDRNKWRSDVPCFGAISDALQHVFIDAAIVAVPCEEHFSSTLELLNVAIPVLLEKPFVHVSSEAELLMELAQNVPLCIGHSERFNPSVTVLHNEISSIGSIQTIRCSRRSPSKRVVGDRDVIYDLAVHDLDLTFSLLGVDVSELSVDSGEFDYNNYCDLTLAFADGKRASIVADRETGSLERLIVIVGSEGVIRCDLLHKTVEVYEGSCGTKKIPVEWFQNREAVSFPVPQLDALECEHISFKKMIEQGQSDLQALQCAVKTVEVSESAHTSFKNQLEQSH